MSTQGTRAADVERAEIVESELTELMDSDEFAHLFRERGDLDLDLVQLEGRRGQGAAGIHFDYARVFGERADGPGTGWGSFVDLRASGTFSFDSEIKPRELLATTLSWRLGYDGGGLVRGDKQLTDAQVAANVAALDVLAEFEDPRELEASEAWREAVRDVAGLLDDQLHWDVGLAVGFEADQDFSQKHLRLGLVSTLEYKSWDPGSLASTLNLVDYPASLLRYVTGYDADWTPSGARLPILNLEVAQVLVDDNRVRRAAGDEDDFLRAHLQASYRSPLGEIGDKLYFLDAAYHHYLDLDASPAIRGAELDDYGYLEVELTTDEGVFLAVDVGQQPFEARDSTVVSLGWRLTSRSRWGRGR